MDKREAILVRLRDVAAEIPGVMTVVRNQDELSEHARPAIAVFDGDEAADERFDQPAHSGRAPNLIEMTPEVLILLGALPEKVGTALNEPRAKLIKAVLMDANLAALVDPNGRVRYDIFSRNAIEGELKYEGANDIGPQMDIHLNRVVFKPGKALNPISDEWGNIEIEGEALANELGKFGSWMVREQQPVP